MLLPRRIVPKAGASVTLVGEDESSHGSRHRVAQGKGMALSVLVAQEDEAVAWRAAHHPGRGQGIQRPAPGSPEHNSSETANNTCPRGSFCDE
jgi:hypothetical protein